MSFGGGGGCCRHWMTECAQSADTVNEAGTSISLSLSKRKAASWTSHLTATGDRTLFSYSSCAAACLPPRMYTNSQSDLLGGSDNESRKDGGEVKEWGAERRSAKSKLNRSPSPPSHSWLAGEKQPNLPDSKHTFSINQLPRDHVAAMRQRQRRRRRSLPVHKCTHSLSAQDWVLQESKRSTATHKNTDTHWLRESMHRERVCSVESTLEERGKRKNNAKRKTSPPSTHGRPVCLKNERAVATHTHERRPRVPGGFFLAKYSLFFLLLPLLPFIHAFIHFSEHRAVRRRPLMSRSGRVRLRAQG